MSESLFSTPSLESMNSFLPAFEFNEIMASNALGAVYFASQKSLDRQVAIKVFSPVLGSDKGFSESFETAAHSAAALRHPNIIGFIDSGIVEGMPFLVMEFVPGKALARSTKGQLIEFGQSMSIIAGICEGIAYAHKKRVVHGNLDTMNILLNRKAEPKIGNFGLSRSVHTGRDVEVPTHFSAPEVLAKSSAPTRASDVYSVAAIFYELITGTAYGPDAPAPSSLTKCPAGVDEIIRKATDPDPAYRMNDVQAFYSALQKAAKSLGQNSPVAVKAETPRKARLTPVAKSSPEEAQAAPQMSRSDRRSAKFGFDSNLLLKLVVIGILVFAVYQMWGFLKESRVERDRENRETVANSKAAKAKAIADANEKRKQDLADRRDTPKTPTPDIPFIAKKIETPKESLARLRFNLRSGRRSEMPIGSIRKGESDYFLVTETMTWSDAAAFAEDHGGYLALPNVDLSWLPSEMTKDRSFWIGVGKSGPEVWTLVDGSAWSPDSGIAGSDQFVFMEEGGSLSTGDVTTLRPFVMQWQVNGSNPGTLASQLKATKASLKGEVPVFPPGTFNFGERHFLHVSRDISWEEAKELAETAGGNLTVVSDEEEATQLEMITKKLKSTNKIWLGGFLKEDQWRWVTGESWKEAKWVAGANASENGLAMIIRPGRGWDGLDEDDEANGFIIEWSDDATKSPGPVEPGTPGNAVDELIAKAKGVVVAADQKRKDALAANIKKIKWDLDAHIRGLKKSDKLLWTPQFELLKECFEANRIELQEIRFKRVRMSQHMAKLVEYHTGKQKEIDEKFIKDAAGIRDVFIVKMTKIRDEANASGQIKVVTDASKTIDRSRNLEAWVEGFEVVYKPKVRERRIAPHSNDLERRRRSFND